MDNKKTFFYFSGTHWDREWYQTFQGFRYRLVDMIDGVLDVMDNDKKFGIFHMDGQTIVLEDYSEIKPENAEKLKKYIAEDKIKIGPWYVMPDEFNLSGESLIRNLQIGHELCKKWNAKSAWKIGYICDIFGHIAQMPQILNGFDIKYSHFSRGKMAFTEPYFIWRSPDGSENLTMRVGNKSLYGEFYHSVVANKHKGKDEVVKCLNEFVDEKIKETKYPVYILADANDHQPIHPEANEYIEMVKDHVPDTEVKFVDLINAFELLEQYRPELEVFEGEFNVTNEKGGNDLISNTLSSYYTLKKANDECQTKLEKIAEPMSAMAMLKGYAFPRNYIKIAYKYLIQNHPHDSICGCSIDQVHKDMEYRFDQTKEICDEIKDAYISKNTNEFVYFADREEGSESIITMFNPLPYEREEVVTIEIPMRANIPFEQKQYDGLLGYEVVNSFHICDFEGNKIPYQIIEVSNSQPWRIQDQKVEYVDFYTVTFKVKLPAGGKCEYKVVPTEEYVRYLEHIKSGVDFMENEHVLVKINPNGTISIFDKATGKTYDNQLTLVDDIEIGDGWTHGPAKKDRMVVSSFGDCRVEKIESGVSKCTFRIIKTLKLPKRYEVIRYSNQRSNEYIDCDAVFDVSLSENARFVDVKLTFNNLACDHRLRLAMPTNVKSDTYFASQPFFCQERKDGIDFSTQNWREHDQYEKSMLGIMGKRDAKGVGLALVNDAGLHECASFNDENKTLYVTLLRAFRKTVNTRGEKRGQLLGELEYNFRFVPLDKSVSYADLLKMQETMAVGTIFNYCEAKVGTELSAPESDYEVSGDNIILSMLKVAENGENALIARVYCASDKDSSATIKFSREIKSAQFVNLNEEPIENGNVKLNGNAVEFKVPGWKIVTVKLSF